MRPKENLGTMKNSLQTQARILLNLQIDVSFLEYRVGTESNYMFMIYEVDLKILIVTRNMIRKIII